MEYEDDVIERERAEETLLRQFTGMCSKRKFAEALSMLALLKEVGYSESLIAEMERVYSEAHDYATV